MRAYVRPTSKGSYEVHISQDNIALRKTVYDFDNGKNERSMDLVREDRFFEFNQIYEIKIEVQGDVINVYVDGGQVIGFSDAENPLVEGMVSFETYDTKAYIDKVEVKAT